MHFIDLFSGVLSVQKLNPRPLLLLVALALSAGLVWYFRLPCITWELFGFYCTGCGATRALDSLLCGNLLSALRNNAPVILCIPPVLVCLFLSAFPKPRALLQRIGRRIPKYSAWLLLLLLLLYTVLRNFPAFSFLAPL